MNDSRLILVRHGQSLWNERNLFTGWVDVPLSLKGIEEAVQAGKDIAHIPVDAVYTSALVRAQQTAFLMMNHHREDKVAVVVHPEEWATIYGEKAKEKTVPVHYAQELNERMYGELQGRDKDETRREFGKEQVHIWRRSFDTPPPAGESLKMTCERTLPYFNRVIVPELEKGKNILIAAHGNSLRSIVMQLDGLGEEEIPQLEIPTGRPLKYRFNQGVFNKESS